MRCSEPWLECHAAAKTSGIRVGPFGVIRHDLRRIANTVSCFALRSAT
jgi:hypothetical protein